MMSTIALYKTKILSVGIEPTTLGLLDPRSNQLSYESGHFFQHSTNDRIIYLDISSMSLKEIRTKANTETL